MSANSSIIFQFSGPFNPRPADTTIFASGNGILSVVCTISLTTVDKSVPETCGWKALISIVVWASTASMVFGVKAITLMVVVSSCVAIALPEKADFLISQTSPLIMGNVIAPSASAASNLAAIRGASPFPLKELDSTMVVACMLFATSAITAAYA